MVDWVLFFLALLLVIFIVRIIFFGLIYFVIDFICIKFLWPQKEKNVRATIFFFLQITDIVSD